MPEALKKHVAWLERKYPDVLKDCDFDAYKDGLDKLAYYAERFGTVDTYAKALHLQGDNEKLSELKLHLSLYFMLEQVTEEKYDDLERKEHLYMRDRRQDLRYMGWLAVLLQDADKLNERVSVISWNYDLQIEHALAYYYQIAAPDLRKVFRTYGIHPGVEEDEDQRRFLVHLNGIAGHCNKGGTGSEFLFETLDRKQDKDFVKGVFERYKDRESQFVNAMNGFFSFAWEDHSIANRGRELAIKAMADATILVIIGYSFPPFNRAVDLQLMKAFRSTQSGKKLKRIHLQNPHMTMESFDHMFGSTIGRLRRPGGGWFPISPDTPDIPSIDITDDTATSQFYLPSGIVRLNSAPRICDQRSSCLCTVPPRCRGSLLAFGSVIRTNTSSSSVVPRPGCIRDRRTSFLTSGWFSAKRRTPVGEPQTTTNTNDKPQFPRRSEAILRDP
ncbi:MAG: hypothetical protein IPM46_00960 [Flavobacteriales bacterium]|nr:hypothetical protein [Flavobacteriales bacterium]